ncbi:hypothetical protein HL658_33880 [Azospirillum sp. RWY-5-1]|uniref:Uncharacterized protein n=1 Tax=Azospirillum oleiclasticum TaxID=2735135 RepID=A0ABX2TJY4_9PROT|nr:hypothetical protein [Azospirillum oleiclasticum]NYZ17560.1 hypothetical protein [Azospirillum oleiclasticum]NYZ24662.1 hypothetical protein [Azospirillum oleiclasticum]
MAPLASIESELLRRLSEIESQIADLEAERNALQRLIAKVRLEESGNKDVKRRNSLSRIIVEGKILELLKSSSGPVSGNVLYKSTLSVVPSLKDVTFRSYLHRMKEKGLIEPAKGIGFWRMPKTQ